MINQKESKKVRIGFGCPHYCQEAWKPKQETKINQKTAIKI